MKLEELSGEGLINRFWELVEPSLQGYSKAMDQLLAHIPRLNLIALIRAMETPDEQV